LFDANSNAQWYYLAGAGQHRLDGIYRVADASGIPSIVDQVLSGRGVESIRSGRAFIGGLFYWSGRQGNELSLRWTYTGAQTGPTAGSTYAITSVYTEYTDRWSHNVHKALIIGGPILVSMAASSVVRIPRLGAIAASGITGSGGAYLAETYGPPPIGAYTIRFTVQKDTFTFFSRQYIALPPVRHR
jgi:hypothetical protein